MMSWSKISYASMLSSPSKYVFRIVAGAATAAFWKRRVCSRVLPVIVITVLGGSGKKIANYRAALLAPGVIFGFLETNLSDLASAGSSSSPPAARR